MTSLKKTAWRGEGGGAKTKISSVSVASELILYKIVMLSVTLYKFVFFLKNDGLALAKHSSAILR